MKKLLRKMLKEAIREAIEIMPRKQIAEEIFKLEEENIRLTLEIENLRKIKGEN